MSTYLPEEFYNLKTQLSQLLKIVHLQQDFNSQQEKQNMKVNKRLADTEKSIQLFKAYTEHDGLNSKLEEAHGQLAAFKLRIDKMEKDMKEDLDNLKSNFEVQSEVQVTSVQKLNERIQSLTLGINTKNRVDFASRLVSQRSLSKANQRSTSSCDSFPGVSKMTTEQDLPRVHTSRSQKFEKIDIASSSDEGSGSQNQKMNFQSFSRQVHEKENEAQKKKSGLQSPEFKKASSPSKNEDLRIEPMQQSLTDNIREPFEKIIQIMNQSDQNPAIKVEENLKIQQHHSPIKPLPEEKIVSNT